MLYIFDLSIQHRNTQVTTEKKGAYCVYLCEQWVNLRVFTVFYVWLWCLSSAGNRNIRFPLCAQCVLSVSSVFSCCQHKAVLRQGNMPHCSFRSSVCALELSVTSRTQCADFIGQVFIWLLGIC